MANTRTGHPSPRSPRGRRSIVLIAALCASASTGLPRAAAAQGISTGTIRGTVRTEDGAVVDGARVRVLNTATGFSLSTRAASGRLFVHGLDVGGPYVVEVRHIGFLPQRSRPLFLTLGEPLDIQFVLQPVAIQLEKVLVTAPETDASVSGGGGTATIIADSLLYRLPTLNRNFLDFVQLAPHVSTKVGFQRSGMSGAGANLRFNSYLVNGAEDRSISSNVSQASAGRSVPMDAVKEYQVLIAPYDVRYGDFAGALVNTVTRSGTNQLRSSVFAYWRNNRLARGGELAPDSLPYERLQYGFSVGGPIIRDRMHFFIAPELQRLTRPAPGPYFGQPPNAAPPLPVSEADVERFAAVMRDRYDLTAGSAGLVEVENPLRRLFARLDAAIPQWNSRAIAFVSYAGAEDAEFERTGRDFYLSSSKQAAASRFRLTSVQFHTDLTGLRGGHNELLVSHSSDRNDRLPAVRQPLVRVLVRGTAGEPVSLYSGTPALAQGVFRRSGAIRVKDELTLLLGARHVLVLGIQGERFRIQPGGVSGGYGTWTFASLDSFEQGVAEEFELRTDLGSASTVLRGGQYAAYAGDEWRVGERLSVTFGVRADLLDIRGRAPYNAVVDSIFGRRTDEMPRGRMHVSPRVGFTWDLLGTGRHLLRGGMGVFTGRPPLAWIHPALANYGVGIGVLRCGPDPGDDAPPPFVPDYRNPPMACAGGLGLPTAPRGDVDLLDRNLRMAQSLRTSLAYDRQLPWGFVATSELLITRYLSDFMFVNLNLRGPQAVDRFGRVMYGTIDATGAATPSLVDTSHFTGVIDLRNTSKNYSRQLSTRLERRFARGIAATASYTYSRTRDVQSPSRVNMSGIVMWADALALSGRHEDVIRGISLNDLPHRAVAALTYTAPWHRWSTGFSIYYVGESGSPFTYRAWGIGGRGDLNADGSNANDAIYVPRSALDASEIQFQQFSKLTGTAVDTVTVGEQQAAFERFTARTPCLRRQRGRIVERNSCREPWSHTTIASVRQAVPIGGRALEVEVDVFNVLNLLNAGWGHYRVADPRLLQHVAQTAGSPETAQPVFRFDPARAEWTVLRTESAFQLQLAIRYQF